VVKRSKATSCIEEATGHRKNNSALRFILPCPILGTALGVAALVFKVIDGTLIREVN